MKLNIKDALMVISAILITGSMAVAMTPPVDKAVEEIVHQEIDDNKEIESLVEEVEPAKEEPEEELTWRDNPKDCDQEKQWIAAEEPFECIDKPKPTKTSAQPVATSAQLASVGSGSCAAEIRKYDWNQTVAHNVMIAESGGQVAVINDNPRTRDYSVGCFQVNLYGANARNRPSVAELQNAEINVRWAYNNYVANGRSFLGQWGVCRSISCY